MLKAARRVAGHTRLTSCAVALTPCVAQLPASCTLAPVLASSDATYISIAAQVPEPWVQLNRGGFDPTH